jgi:hypothetical protein
MRDGIELWVSNLKRTIFFHCDIKTDQGQIVDILLLLIPIVLLDRLVFQLSQ